MAQYGLPSYFELMLPTLKAVEGLGGSALSRQITDKVITDLEFTEEEQEITYESSAKSVIVDRCNWARSYCKLTNVLDSPKRGLFVLSELGRDVLAMPDEAATETLRTLDAEVRSRYSKKTSKTSTESESAPPDEEDPGGTEWREQLLTRLHALSPDAFEEFVLYLLRTFDLELERTGGTGDRGIDGIGTAPVSPVLSSVVAVQAKRIDPTKSVGRDVVALFQRDAAAQGAERAILVTLGRFTRSARRAAQVTTPTVDLIDGTKLCDLVRDQEIDGLRRVFEVDTEWFDRFEP